MSDVCSGCKYWRGVPKLDGVSAATRGECRKSAPALAGGRSVTKASDSCYQYRPKKRQGEGKFTR